MLELNDYQLCHLSSVICHPALQATRYYKGGGGGAPQRDLYQETADELRAKSDLAPTVFATEAQFDPMYAGLNNNLLNTALFGNEGSTMTMPTPGYSTATQDYNTAMSAYNRSFGGDRPGGRGISQFGRGIPGRGGNILRMPAPIPPTMQPTTTVNVPGSPGLLSMASKAATQARTANINDWANLSPAAMAAIKQSNPQLANMIDTMMQQSQYEMGLGGNLDPAALRQAQQSIRSRQAGMLGGTGNAGDYGEALGISQFGQGLRQQRFGNATTAAGMSDSFYSPKIASLMGNGIDWQTILGMGQNMSQGGPRLFGSTVNANDVADTNFNAAESRRNAAANNNAALTTAGISAGAGILAALI